MDSFADTQPMDTSISLEADFAVKPGCIEGLQDLRALMLHHAGSRDLSAAGALESNATPGRSNALGFRFDAALSSDNQTFSVRCGAPLEEPIRQMLLRIGPDLAQLETSARLTRLHCTGAVSPALQHALTRFNSTFA